MQALDRKGTRSMRRQDAYWARDTSPEPTVTAGVSLRSLAMVVAKYPAQSFPAEKLAFATTDFAARIDDPVDQGLVISFRVVVNNEFANSDSQ